MKNLEAKIQTLIMDFQHAGRTDVSALARDILIAAAVPDMIDAIIESEDYPPFDAGCIECTAGRVKKSRNTGLCAYHLRRVALNKVFAP